MGNQYERYLKGKQPQQQLKIRFACTLCQGELVHTDWAPTCIECGAVHECVQHFVREMDFKKPQTRSKDRSARSKDSTTVLTIEW